MMNLNVSPSPFPLDHIHEDHDHPFAQNYCLVPNSTSSGNSYNFFFDSTRDQAEYNYHQQSYQTQLHQEDDNYYAYNHNGQSSYEKVENSSLKLTLWKKEVDDDDQHGPKIVQDHKNNNSIINPEMKWMSSKMRVMHKMKSATTTSTTPDRVVPNIISTTTKTNVDHEDHNNKVLKRSSVSSMETTTHHDELSSNTSSSYINNNSPIRVCADCNTTKTPLWRSGPKGPKSLCNACGIRQRKARRAMAAANAAVATPSQTVAPPALKIIKVQHKEKKIGKAVHASNLKKRCKMVVNDTGSTSNGEKKLGFEDFLINLSKNLAFHRVFPEDERDAALLLMAISSGLVHG